MADRPRYLIPGEPGHHTSGTYLGSRDGDTPKMLLPILGEWPIRLHNTWADEKYTELGKQAWAYLDEILRDGVHPLQVWLADPIDFDHDGRISAREIFATSSFDRWPGTVFVNYHDVRQILIEAGHAVWKVYRKERP